MNFAGRLPCLISVALFFTVTPPLVVKAQNQIDINTVADELTKVGAFVARRSVLTGERPIIVQAGETLEIDRQIISADKIVLGSGANLRLKNVSAHIGSGGVYLVAREIVLPKSGDPAVIGWARGEKPAAAGGTGRAGNGANGAGAGQSGKPGGNGKQGQRGQNGADAPFVTIVALSINKGQLKIDLAGGTGGDSGRGQAGGHGGNGAQGTPARTAWISILGAKTAAGCATGPGRGGTGGNGGNGGVGGPGGNGGAGGILRLVSTPQVADWFFDTVSIDIAPGASGNGGPGGEHGNGGVGGREGPLASHCSSAGRQGAHGRNGNPGAAGPMGAAGRQGQRQRVDLSANQMISVFEFSEAQ